MLFRNNIPNKLLCILVPAPYLHLFSTEVQITHFYEAILDKKALNFVHILHQNLIYAKIAFNGAIWDEFRKQY